MLHGRNSEKKEPYSLSSTTNTRSAPHRKLRSDERQHGQATRQQPDRSGIGLPTSEFVLRLRADFCPDQTGANRSVDTGIFLRLERQVRGLQAKPAGVTMVGKQWVCCLFKEKSE
jgi:hypothetical protein